MPLIITTVFFVLLFTFEAAWHWAGEAAQERALIRYQHVEHPRRQTSDAYLDMLG